MISLPPIRRNRRTSTYPEGSGESIYSSQRLIEKEVKDEMVEVVMTAMEKFHWDSTEIANYMKRELDIRFGCSWHVVVGEEFGFDVDFEEGQMLYLYYGSLALLIWKCGTQLLKEVKYKKEEEDELVKKAKLLTKGAAKYTKMLY